jgi:hypothetical protein
VPRRIAFSPICAGPRCGYVAAEDLKPIIAVSVGIAVFRGIVTPLLARYLAWRNGVYVPDLNVERGERVFWPAYLRVVALGLAIGWRVMASS